MKILSVTTILPDTDAQWLRVTNIASHLRSLGSEVEIVHYIIKGFESYRILSSKRYLKNENSITVGSPIIIPFVHLKKLYSKKYDFVYGNTYSGAFFSIFGKLLGVPLILDMHGISEEFLTLDKRPSHYKLFLMKFMEFMSLFFSDKIICVSKTMVNYLHKEKGIKLKKLVYGTNGVDLTFYKSQDIELVNDTRVNLGIEHKLVFGYIGGFQGYQGVRNFVEAARGITDKRLHFLVIGGEKPSEEGNITFIPKLPREQIPLYYSVCDVLVLPRPSHIATEVAAPTKFAEYCAMGKPILTTDVGDAAELVRIYKNGLIVENNDPETLKKGILDFLKLEDDVLLNMGKNSRRLAEKEFNWYHICFMIVKELENI